MTCKIITFSGVDGAGKSTIIEYVEKELKSSGFRVINKVWQSSHPVFNMKLKVKVITIIRNKSFMVFSAHF